MKSVIFLIAACVAGGIGMLVAGVYVLAGLGWCLVAGAAFAFGAAGVLLRGVRGLPRG